MSDFRTITFLERLRRRWLDVNARLEHALFDMGRSTDGVLIAIREISDSLKLSGTPRTFVALISEAATFGTLGAIVMLALALPAFRETERADWLKKQELAVVFTDQAGNEIGRRGILHDDSLRLEELPDHLIKAVLATEDRRFFEHFGIDIPGLFRALSVNARANGVVQGGSTLTQQLAKNLFLSNERSIQRKIKEAFLALWLEYNLSKNDILKLYLDRGYLGNGVFGVQAAAEQYFGKSVKDLTLAESAMVAGLFKAPTKYAPHINLPAARARANDVLSNMVEAGFLTDGQIAAAKRNPAETVPRQRDVSPDYYMDFAFEEIRKLVDEDKLHGNRVLRARTSIDVSLQKHADRTVEELLRKFGAQYDVEQAALVIQEHDGAVKAVVGGRDYGASQFNRATHALRQPGSSFKPYVYVAALAANLIKPNTVVVDRPVCVGDWCPRNYSGGFSGAMPAISALARSINSIPVQLTGQLGHGNHREGRKVVIQTARRLGIQNEIHDTASLPLGAAEVTVADMTAAYTVFANGGRRAKSYAVTEIRNSSDEVIYTPPPPEIRNERLLPASVIADLNTMLHAVVEQGTGRRAKIPGWSVAGKTGTTDAYRNAWFVGYTGSLVGAVWAGNDDYSSTANMTGGTLPATIWQTVMAVAHQDRDPRPLFGVDVPGPLVATAPTPDAVTTGSVATVRPAKLTRKATEVVEGIETLMKSSRVQASQGFAAPVMLGEGGGFHGVAATVVARPLIQLN